MANRELLITLGADTTTFQQKIKRARDLTKELDTSFKLTASSSKDFEKSIEGLGKKQDYLADRMKIANAANKTYVSEMKTQQSILDNLTQEQKKYTQELEKMNNALASGKLKEGTIAYELTTAAIEQMEEELQSVNKSVKVYTDRMINLTKASEQNQIEMQKMAKEIAEVDNILDSMSKQTTFDAMNDEIVESQRLFNNIKTSTEDFGKSMKDLVLTQDHYESQLQKTQNIMTKYSTEMEESNRAIERMESNVRELTREVSDYENKLKGMKASDDGFEYTENKLKNLREELVNTNVQMDHHKKTVDVLGKEYKTLENSSAGLTSELNKVKVQMKNMSDVTLFREVNKDTKYFKDVTIGNLSKKLGELKVEFDKTNATTDKFSNSMEGLNNKQKALKEMLDVTKKSIKAYNEQLEQLTTEQKEVSNELKKTEKSLDYYTKKLSTLDNSSDVWDKTKLKIESLKDTQEEFVAKLDTLNKKTKESEQGLKAMTQENIKLSSSMQKTKEKMDQMVDAVNFEPIIKETKLFSEIIIEDLERGIESLNNQLNKLDNEIDNLEGSFTGLSRKQELLNDSIVESNKLLDAYDTEIKSTSNTIEELNNRNEELLKTLKEQEIALKKNYTSEAKEEFERLKIEYKEVNEEIDKQVTKQKKLQNEYKTTSSNIRQLEVNVERTKDSLKELNNQSRFTQVEQSIERVKHQFEKLDSVLEVVKSQYKDFENSMSGAIRESSILKQQTAQLKEEFTQQNKAIALYKNELNELGDEKTKLIAKIERLENSLDGLKGTPQFDNMTSEIARAENALQQLDNEIDQVTQSLRTMELEANATLTSMNNNIHQQSRGWDLLGTKMIGFGQGLQSVGQTMLPLSMAMGALGTITVKTGMEFQSAMSQVGAISGATTKEIELLTVKAREMGATTKFSATESAEAFNYMAMAGWKTDEMLDGIEGTLSLAAASGAELGTVADIVTDGLTAMGYSAKDTGDFVDVLAQTMASSNTNIEMISQTMKYAGAVAGTYKINIEDLALAIGTMANSGIKASQAGTTLRAGITRLVNPTEKAKTMMDKYGISIAKTEDGGVDLEETIKSLRAGFDKMKDSTGAVDVELQGMAADVIFGKTAMTGWLSIINTSETDLTNLANAIKNSSGAADEMAKKMNDNLKGDMAILVSTIQESFISIFDSIEPVLRDLTQKATVFIQSLTDKFNKLSPTMQKMVVNFVAFSAILPPLLIGFGLMTTALGYMIKISSTVVSKFKTLTLAFKQTSTTGTLFSRMTSTMAGKMSLLGGALGIAAVALGVTYVKGQEKAIEGTDKLLKGMDKVEKGMVKPFLEANKGIETALIQLGNFGSKMTYEISDEILSNLSSLTRQTKDLLSQSEKEISKILEGNFKTNANLSTEHYDGVVKRVESAMDKKVKQVEKAESRIVEINQSALNENRKLTLAEQKEVTENLETINKIAYKAMSINSSQMLEIQQELSKNAGSIRAEELVEAVGNAKEKKDKTVEQANEEHRKLVETYEFLKDDLNINDKKIFESAISNSKARRDEVVKIAEDEHAKIIKTARMMAGDMVDEIDWSTGEMKSKWQKFWDNMSAGWDGFWLDVTLTMEKGNLIFDKNLKGYKDGIKNTIDVIKVLPNDLKQVARDMNNTLEQQMGVSLSEFANNVDGSLDKVKDHWLELPSATRETLREYDRVLKEEMGVQGGLDSYIKHLQGKIDTIRMEYSDLSESTKLAMNDIQATFTELQEELDGITFENFMMAAVEGTGEAKKMFEKMPTELATMIANMPKEEWAELFEYYKGVAGAKLGETGEVIVEEGNKNAEKQHESGEKQGKSLVDGTEKGIKDNTQNITNATQELIDAANQTVENNKEKLNTTSTEAGKGMSDAFQGGLQDLPIGIKEQLEQVGVTINEDGSLIVADMDEQARKASMAYVDGLKSNLPQLDGVTADIMNRLGGIDNIKLGNVTKQLSEINRWLGLVQNSAITTNVEITKLTILSWGNTTKGLSEVNQWLMRTTNRSKDSEKALSSIIEVTFGKTTKGLSEVERWLGNVVSKAKETRSALVNISNVKYGGVTKGLSEINKWLNTVKASASGTRSALSSVAQAKGFSLQTPEQTLPSIDVGQTMANYSRDSWLDFGDISKYKTSGSYYEPKSSSRINTSTNQSNTDINNLLKATLEQNKLLLQILNTNNTIDLSVQLDGRQIAKASSRYMEAEISSLSNKKNRLRGI